MSPRTVFVLLGLILLFAVYGWRGLGWILFAIGALVLIGIFWILTTAWLLRRKMRRALGDLQKAMGQHGFMPDARRREPSEGDVIDVEATKVRDEGTGGPGRPPRP